MNAVKKIVKNIATRKIASKPAHAAKIKSRLGAPKLHVDAKKPAKHIQAAPKKTSAATPKILKKVQPKPATGTRNVQAVKRHVPVVAERQKAPARHPEARQIPAKPSRKAESGNKSKPRISGEEKEKQAVQGLLAGENVFVTVPGTRSDALRVLGKYDVSGVPVVQKKTGELAGVITRTDILRKPEEDQLALLMTSTPITIKGEDPVEKAIKIFYEKKIRCLPVIDNKGVLLGTIRPMDVLNAYADETAERVGDCLTGCTVPVYQDTPLPVVMAILNITKATALPVLDKEGKLSGIVADGDLFKLSTEEEKTAMSRFGIAGDEDKWSWEGIRDAMLLYHQTTKTKLPVLPVKDMMVKDPVSVFKDALVKVAIWKMRKFNFNQLPVVDEQNNLVGIVSDLDMMGALVK